MGSDGNNSSYSSSSDDDDDDDDSSVVASTESKNDGETSSERVFELRHGLLHISTVF